MADLNWARAQLDKRSDGETFLYGAPCTDISEAVVQRMREGERSSSR